MFRKSEIPIADRVGAVIERHAAKNGFEVVLTVTESIREVGFDRNAAFVLMSDLERTFGVVIYDEWMDAPIGVIISLIETNEKRGLDLLRYRLRCKYPLLRFAVLKRRIKNFCCRA